MNGGNRRFEKTPAPRRGPPGSPLEGRSLPTRAAQQLLQPVERGAAVGPGAATSRLHGGRRMRLVPGADPRLPVPLHRPALAEKSPGRAGGWANSGNHPDSASLRPDSRPPAPAVPTSVPAGRLGHQARGVGGAWPKRAKSPGARDGGRGLGEGRGATLVGHLLSLGKGAGPQAALRRKGKKVSKSLLSHSEDSRDP